MQKIILKHIGVCRNNPRSCRLSVFLCLLLAMLSVYGPVNHAAMLLVLAVLIGMHIVWELHQIKRLLHQGHDQ